MKNRSSPKPPPNHAAWIGLLVALAVCTAVVLRVLAPFFSVILFALVAAGLIGPSYRRLVRTFRGRRQAAAVLICVALLGVLLVPLFLIAHEVSQEALTIYEMSTTQLTRPQMMATIEQWQPQIDRLNLLLEPIGKSVTTEDVYELLASLGVRVGGFFYKQGVSVAKGLVQFVFGFIFWVLILFYLLVDGDTFRTWIEETIPLPADEQALVANRFTEMASSLVIGNGVAGLIQGFVGGLVFAAAGIEGAVLWGVVMSILAFIPVVGISLVFIPFSAFFAFAGDTDRALLIFLPLATVATVVEYWLKPRLVGRRAQMHSLLVFLSLIGGISTYGAVGLLLGPLMMTAFLTLVSIYREHYRRFVVPATESPAEVGDDD